MGFEIDKMACTSNLTIRPSNNDNSLALPSTDFLSPLMNALFALAAAAFGLAAKFAALWVVLLSLGFAVESASPTAALAGLAFLLCFFSLVFPRLRKEYLAASVGAVLGGLLAHFNGSGSFSSGAFTMALVVFVLSLVFEHFPGFLNVPWKVAVALCRLAPDLSSFGRASFGKLRGNCRHFPEVIENVVLMIPMGHLTLRELINEGARRCALEMRFAEQRVTLGEVLYRFQAAVDEFHRVHPNRRLSHCVRRFQAEQIPLAENEDGLFERDRSTTWKRLLCLSGFHSSWLKTELARLKAYCARMEQVISRQQQYIASAVQIRKIVVKETAAYPIVKIPAVARLPSRALVPKPDSFVPAVFTTSPKRTEEKKDMSVFEMIVSTARNPRSKTKVLPVTETEVELPQTPDHSHSDPPASPAPAAIIEDSVVPLSPSSMVLRAFYQIERRHQALRDRFVSEDHAVSDATMDEMMSRPRKESAVTKEARFARERSLIAYRNARAEKEKEIDAVVAVPPAVVTDAQSALPEESKVTSAPAAAAADTPPSVLPEDTPAHADAVAPPPSDHDLMSELRVALAARGRSIRKTPRADDTPAKLKAANATVPATSSSGDEWVTEDEDDSDGSRDSDDDDSDSEGEFEGPFGPDDDSDDGDEDDAPPPGAPSAILAVVDGEQASPSEPIADVDDNDKHGSPGPSGATALPEAEVSFDSEAGAQAQSGGSTRDVVLAVSGDKQSEDADDKPEISYEKEGEEDSSVGIDQQLLVTELDYPPLPPSPTTMTTTRNEAESSFEEEAEQKVLLSNSGTGSGLMSAEEEEGIQTPPVGSSPVVSVEAQTENAADVDDIMGLLETLQISDSAAQAVATPLVTTATTTTVTTDIIGDFTATTADATATPVAITSPEFGTVWTEEAVMGTDVYDDLPGMELDEDSLARPESMMVYEEVEDEDSRMEEADADDEGEDTAMDIIPDAEVEGPPAATFDWGFGSTSMSGTPFTFGAVQDDVDMDFPQQQDFENVEMVDQGVFGDSLTPSVEASYPSLPAQGDMWYPEADVLMDEPAPAWSIINTFEGGNFAGFGEQQQGFPQWPQQQQYLEPMDYHHDVEVSSFQPSFDFGQQQPLVSSQPGDYGYQLDQQLAQIDFGQDNLAQPPSEVASASEDVEGWSMSEAELEQLQREIEQELMSGTPETWSAQDSLVDPALLALPTNQATDVAAPITAASSPQGEEVVAPQGREEGGASGPSAPTTTTAFGMTFPGQGISFSFESRSDVFASAPAEDEYVDSYVPVHVAPVLRQGVEPPRRREPRSNGSTPVEVVRPDDRQDEVPAEPDSSSDEESVRQRVARRPMLVPRIRGSVAVRQAAAEPVQSAGESSSAPRRMTIQEMRARIEAMRRTGASDFEEDVTPSSPIPSAPNFRSEGSTTTTTSEEPEPVAEGSSGSAEVKEGQPAEELELNSSEVEAHQEEEAELEAAVAEEEEEEGLGHETQGTGRRRRRHVLDIHGIEYVEPADIPVHVTEGRRILPCKVRIPRANEEPD
ncbi:hypothetical protein QBC41DRAFT_349437 [Cercophora samala]|uniref:Uncharacterized protein n=1 Tax=Cercophora samala TaxID=330535 RepID=A0AA39Z7J5_9PEZI|nr:hypothetical protein QBC41DRAFT_349437 [Cercophora samala]